MSEIADHGVISLSEQAAAWVVRLSDSQIGAEERADFEVWLAAGASIGEKLMAEQAEKYGFTIDRAIALRLNRINGTYRYMVRSSKDIQDKRGVTSVFFDANSGELKRNHPAPPSFKFSG